MLTPKNCISKISQNRISKDGFGVKADFEYDAISAG
jgi:hypothetical protein